MSTQFALLYCTDWAPDALIDNRKAEIRRHYALRVCASVCVCVAADASLVIDGRFVAKSFPFPLLNSSRNDLFNGQATWFIHGKVFFQPSLPKIERPRPPSSSNCKVFRWSRKPIGSLRKLHTDCRSLGSMIPKELSKRGKACPGWIFRLFLCVWACASLLHASFLCLRLPNSKKYSRENLPLCQKRAKNGSLHLTFFNEHYYVRLIKPIGRLVTLLSWASAQ